VGRDAFVCQLAGGTRFLPAFAGSVARVAAFALVAAGPGLGRFAALLLRAECGRRRLAEILSSIGLVRQPANLAHVFVARTGTPASNEWKRAGGPKARS